MGKMCYRLPDN